jgi:hypothetical protein
LAYEKTSAHVAAAIAAEIAGHYVAAGAYVDAAAAIAAQIAAHFDADADAAHIYALLLQLLELDANDDVHFTEDDTPCPVDCVIEVFEPKELQVRV